MNWFWLNRPVDSYSKILLLTPKGLMPLFGCPCECSRERRVNRSSAQTVERPNVDVAGRNRQVVWQLSLDANNGLQTCREIEDLGSV